MAIRELNNRQGYSADVSLKLRVQNELIDVAKVGPSRIVLREPRHIPAGSADLIISVGSKTTLQNIIVSPGDDALQVNYW